MTEQFYGYLLALLGRNVAISDAGRDGFFALSDDDKWLSPGCWVAYIARARARGLSTAALDLPDPLLGYAKAMGIERALDEPDSYEHKRTQQGKTYSPVVVLESAEHTDRSTQEINSCIRAQFVEVSAADFVGNVCEVVGDLLDNVWSHGKSTGMSLAQKWGQRDRLQFEFAVADCGIGLLSEVRRAGIPYINDDESAIAWCIQKGHTTKRRAIEPLTQRLPPDATGNPMQGFAQVIEGENHHAGLGLWKLIECVRRYGGQLYLASGSSILTIHPGGKAFKKIKVQWQGVAIACRFDASATETAARRLDKTTEEFGAILGRLLGEKP